MVNFSNKAHSVSFTTKLEKIEGRNNQVYYSCIIWFNVVKGFNSEDKISITLSPLELRTLGHAINELLVTGRSSYGKYADTSASRYAKDTNQKKSIFVNTKDNVYYINVNINNKPLGIAYTMLEFNSIKDAIENLANTIDNKLFELNSLGL
ncbi:hypothetical protein CRV02_13050 [Arcobacter sp. CECT 8989]|uniref:hypothetical protein n=1 Tax=Arcobacter sp. CECT 8989 TaxID=2044509 RepID=UPI00100C0922|nr:hypothetical protein [Arcobacter sp. CECT 8989]RXJ98673.1 hypothetical protein CRV02_13050 [Arcobacter sp. CECT 8989]